MKLCVVIPEGDSEAAERRLYLEVESELPFDALVYTGGEWKELLESARQLCPPDSGDGERAV